jgi:hypothetical protein
MRSSAAGTGEHGLRNSSVIDQLSYKEGSLLRKDEELSRRNSSVIDQLSFKEGSLLRKDEELSRRSR